MSKEKGKKKARSCITIHTDGACSGNPGPGGWAYCVSVSPLPLTFSGGNPNTTNNRMELTAVIEALKSLSAPGYVKIYTDSMYVCQGTQEWLPKWKKNGWKTSTRATVANKDLWVQLDELIQIHRVEFVWVKGHAGCMENEICDTLARREVEKFRG